MLSLLPLKAFVDSQSLLREEVDLPGEGADLVIIHLPIHCLEYPLLEEGELLMNLAHVRGVGTQKV
jgi:hypothetical protein